MSTWVERHNLVTFLSKSVVGFVCTIEDKHEIDLVVIVHSLNINGAKPKAQAWLQSKENVFVVEVEVQKLHKVGFMR